MEGASQEPVHERERLAAASSTPKKPGHAGRRHLLYDVEVVPEQDYKASEFKLGCSARPHMRAFHYAWFGFFMSKFAGSAIRPLLGYMKTDLNLTSFDLQTATLISYTSIAVFRLVAGPFCDVYGPRFPIAVMLCLGSIPAALTGLINAPAGLYVTRILTGMLSGTLVPAEFWASRMFAKEIVGTANALVAGWGDLGSAISVLIMSNVLLPWFQAMTHGNDTLVWRTVSVVPATMALVTGVLLYRFSDDTPRGNYVDLKREDSVLAARRPLASFCAACWSSNTWVLVEQYACCSGVEKVMVIAASYYFRGKFGLCKEAANSIEAIFGWLDFFARPLGGIASDYANHRWGMRGRLWVQAVILLVEGGLILALAWCQTLAGSIAVLVLSSLFVKAAKGSTFAVVPYVSPLNTGSVIGLVAAGGSAGTIAFDFVFDGMSNRRALNVAGGIVMASSVLTAVISIRGHRGLFFGMDRNVDPETGELRGKDSSNRSTTNSYGDREVAVETANL